MLKMSVFMISIIGLAMTGAFSRDTESKAGLLKEAKITMKKASGEFEVQVIPQKDEGTEAKIGRMLLKKRYSGGLVAEAEGQMLAAMTDIQGSAGYVAIERVTGTLDGRKGSFVLIHKGTMAHGAQEMSITVVPDSGTDELKGLTGTLGIRIADGKHYYDFEYSISE